MFVLISWIVSGEVKGHFVALRDPTVVWDEVKHWEVKKFKFIDSLKQCNSSVIIPNGPVNSEVNLSVYRDDGRVTAETCVGWIEQK